MLNRTPSLEKSLASFPSKKPRLEDGGSRPQTGTETPTRPGNRDWPDALHIYVGRLPLSCYFKKQDPFVLKRGRLIAASRPVLRSWLPLGLRNKFFTNTRLLLKNGIHHKPSREEAAFDGHNTIIQSTVSFLFNSIRRGVNISGKEKTHTHTQNNHGKALVNINQKCTPLSRLNYPLRATPGDNVLRNLLFA